MPRPLASLKSQQLSNCTDALNTKFILLLSFIEVDNRNHFCYNPHFLSNKSSCQRFLISSPKLDWLPSNLSPNRICE